MMVRVPSNRNLTPMPQKSSPHLLWPAAGVFAGLRNGTSRPKFCIATSSSGENHELSPRVTRTDGAPGCARH